jgi:hypothetical protein
MESNNNISEKPRVRQDEIGLYIRTIELDYRVNSNQEMADLITHFFNVLCLEEDVVEYKSIAYDWELESRREEYFSSINRVNPYL